MIILLKDIKLSDNFWLSEFVCKCGCNQVVINENHIKKLQFMHEHFGVSISPYSAYRCLTHNRSIGSKDTSQHLLGATDFHKIKGYTLQDLWTYADVNFDGVGFYNWGAHIDTRGFKARWDKRT